MEWSDEEEHVKGKGGKKVHYGGKSLREEYVKVENVAMENK